MSSTAKVFFVALVAFALGFLSHQLLPQESTGPEEVTGPEGLAWEVEGESLRLSRTEPGRVLIGWGTDNRVDLEGGALTLGRDDPFTIASLYRVKNGRVEPYLPCMDRSSAAFCTPVEAEPLGLECTVVPGPRDAPICVFKKLEPKPMPPIPEPSPRPDQR